MKRVQLIFSKDEDAEKFADWIAELIYTDDTGDDWGKDSIDLISNLAKVQPVIRIGAHEENLSGNV